MVDPSRGDEPEDEAPEEGDDAERSAEAVDEDGAAGDAPDGDESPAEASAAADDVPDRTKPGLTAPSAGTRLREAREARGLRLEDLARTLNLHPRIVAALEADDEDALPAAPFVRGYLRSYARLMSMDPTPLLEDHERRTGGVVVEVRPLPRIEETIESPGLVHKRPGTVMGVVTLGFVAVAVGALMLLRPDALPGPPGAEDAAAGTAIETPTRSASPAPSPARTPGAAPAIEPVVDRSGEGAGQGAGQGAGRGAADVDASGQDVDATEPVAPFGDAEAPPAAPPTPSGDGDADADAEVLGDASEDGILRTRTADGRGQRVYAGGEDHLHFAFTQDCWVEVLDADGVSVYEDLNRDGEVLDLWGRAPFTIRLGYAPAVELTYNGSRVALRPFTRNDVASLTLGR